MNIRGILKRKLITQRHKEEWSFTGMTVIIMAAIMLSYNAVTVLGLTDEAVGMILTQYIPIAIAAFIINQMVVSHNVHRFHKILVRPDSSKFKDMMTFVTLMVIGMCLSLSLYTTLVFNGTENFWYNYLTAVARNFPVALIAEFLIAGPIVRTFHQYLFRRTKLVE